MAEPAKEFIPSPRSKDCTKKPGGWGRPMADYEYIWFGNKGEDDYPEEACLPYYHKSAQIDDFQVNTKLTSQRIECPDIQGVINQQSWKGFDIKHPNKENHRLRHICLEGPEAGVYYRGRLTNSNVIELPEYWRGLIDPETPFMDVVREDIAPVMRMSTVGELLVFVAAALLCWNVAILFCRTYCSCLCLGGLSQDKAGISSETKKSQPKKSSKSKKTNFLYWWWMY